jgi:putative transposase
MARLARLVLPGFPHHLTQRGTDRSDVFFSDDDRRMYLTLLRDHCRRSEISVIAWCLMTNHVHMVVVPGREDSVATAFGRTHNEYARWLHTRQRRAGHLWQKRLQSCPLEECHLWDAVLYVEMNPVRAGMAEAAADWPWSSARAHLSGQDPWHILDLTWWRANCDADWWPEVLRAGFQEAALAARLREATRTGRPFGSDDFVRRIECAVGRPVGRLKAGRKRKTGPAPAQMKLGIA